MLTCSNALSGSRWVRPGLSTLAPDLAPLAASGERLAFDATLSPPGPFQQPSYLVVVHLGASAARDMRADAEVHTEGADE